MVNYRQILRLYSLNYPQREIAASVHSSRSTLHEVISIASKLAISWPLVHSVTNAVLETLLYPERAEKQTDRMPMDYPKIHRNSLRVGFPVLQTSAGRYTHSFRWYGLSGS